MGRITSVLQRLPAAFALTLSLPGFLSIRFSCVTAVDSGLVEPGVSGSHSCNRMGGVARSSGGTWGACPSR
jgi:hypothetical protein